jgi:cobalt/nickel transport system permease protein
MHIPDGFLSTPVWGALDATSIPAVGLLARHARLDVEDGRIPLLGVLGAFIFAAQMVNFPVGFGTSGHLIGGTLLACTIGPAAAALVMTAILAVQAFLFQDGGVLALGANVTSMALIGVLAGYLPYRFLGRGRYRDAAVFAGGVLSVLASAATAVALLYISGVTMPAALLGIPAVAFAGNAIIEGLITVAVLRAIARINPHWIRTPTEPNRQIARVFATAALLLAGCGFLLASVKPDGFERLTDNLGLVSQGTRLLASPLADYVLSPAGNVFMGRAAAGLIGIALAYFACTGLGRAAARLRRM